MCNQKSREFLSLVCSLLAIVAWLWRKLKFFQKYLATSKLSYIAHSREIHTGMPSIQCQCMTRM